MRAALLALLCSALAAQQPPSYNRDIRPILADRCFACHGPDAEAREASLRLDVREDATKARGSRPPAIVPGNPRDSLVMQRMRHADTARRMPPVSSKLVVSDEEVALIGRWIEAGAAYEQHWAFVPGQRVPRPDTPTGAWARDPLDHHVMAALRAADLQPSSPAAPETWLRRVTLDLTGLPPTLEELDTFLADLNRSDASADASFERAVDRLLASPRFGERMASDWLDVARYADTFGYQSDVYRDVWPWRDWVIDAFNKNLPYDDFITWQLAGDLLPNPTREQRLATTFNRLHRQTNEGGSVEEEYRQEYIGDRVHTMGTAFLGLTLECARCHDHKFDPITQREYYGLAAFFSNIDESGLYSHFTRATPTPTLDLPTPAQEEQLAAADDKIEAAERALDATRTPDRQRFASWLKENPTLATLPDSVGRFSFEKLDDKRQLPNAADPSKPGRIGDNPQIIPGGAAGNALLLSGENSAYFPGIAHVGRHDPLSISIWIKIPENARDRVVVMHRSRAWTDAASQGHELLVVEGKLRWSLIHFWPGDAISIETIAKAPIGRWTHVVVTHDGSSRASGLGLFIDGKQAPVNPIKDNLTRSIMGGGGHFTLGQRFRDMGFKGGMVDELEVFSRALRPIEVTALHARTPLEPRDDARGFAWWLEAIDTEHRRARAALLAARKERAKIKDRIRNIMVMEELPERRTTRVLRRGQYDQPVGEAIRPGTPRVLPPLAREGQEATPRDRLALAAWLTRSDHPLTARVAVNRLWQIAFGTGLVATPDNFGTQGVPPTHAGLLDTLARDFVDSGWDIKAMLRRLVLSSTYRQAGTLNEHGRSTDRSNAWLWHGPIKRLTAEMLRDQALFAAGLLVDQRGGPPVKPYQPAGLWREKSGQTYHRDKGNKLYRRSLYTFWKRTSPPPSMMILDGAKRDVCVPRRHTTNTPLQALLLMNDPQFVEAARVLADRALIEAQADIQQAVIIAFRKLTARAPRNAELDALVSLQKAHQAQYANDQTATDALLKTGDSKPPKHADRAAVAALANVCTTILASDASVTVR